MKIISKFKDCYDAAGLAYGIDDKVIYVRETKTIAAREISDLRINVQVLKDYLKDIPAIYDYGDLLVVPCVLGFCGKLYPLFQIKGPAHFIYPFPESDYIAYSEKAQIQTWFQRYNSNEIKLIKGKIGVALEDIFFQLKAPVFIYGNKTAGSLQGFEINPRLADLKFQHYLEPIKIFQEISMFVSILNNKTDIEYAVGGDKIIAQSKGFDEKSFTQSAPTKKQKRLLNKQNKRLRRSP